eukprot:Awhi_evm2s5579
MVADVVGVGVLTLAGAVASLGWVIGFLSLVIFLPVNAYTGILLSRAFVIAKSSSVTMMDMGRECWGKWAGWLIGAYVYATLFFIVGDYLIVTGQSLGMIFYDVHICKPIWTLIGTACIVPVLQFSRNLNDAKFLTLANMGFITISVIIAVVVMIKDGRDENAVTEVVAKDMDVFSFFGGLSSMVFAYSGQSMYLEMIAEMKRPQDFPKTFAITAPYQLFMYSFVSFIGYFYKGNLVSGFIINNIPYGPAYRAAAALLFLHMIITVLIKGQVLSRALHLAIHPNSANDYGVKGKVMFFFSTVIILGSAYVLSAAVPFFDYVTSILGAWLTLPTFIFPAGFLWTLRRRQNKPIHIAERVFMVVVCFGFAAVLTFIGTWSSISGIMENYSTLGGPFSCQCHDIWESGCTH